MENTSNNISLYTYALQQEILCLLNLADIELCDKTREIPLFNNKNEEEVKSKGLHSFCQHQGCINTHECNTCNYHIEHFLFVANCISRDKDNSLWEEIVIYGPFVFGGMDEYRTVNIAGRKKESSNGLYYDIASVTSDYSKLCRNYINYYDSDSNSDNYALSMIIEALRIIV